MSKTWQEVALASEARIAELEAVIEAFVETLIDFRCEHEVLIHYCNQNGDRADIAEQELALHKRALELACGLLNRNYQIQIRGYAKTVDIWFAHFIERAQKTKEGKG